MPDVANKVGRYELLHELGQGGMATVFLAHQSGLDREVALKRLDALRASNPDFARRFLREARVAGSLNHPNIVTVYEYLEEGGTPYIAMEYVPHGSLRPHVGRLSLPQVGGVMAGMLSGLAHAEEQGIVHRDLKPENLMVTSDGNVKIADFGIAKATRAVRASASLTAVGTTLGTPQYMAPEQARGQRVGPWTDLYAVGIIAFELLVGNAPFHDTENPMAVLMRHVNEPVPRVSTLLPQLDPSISDWIARLLVKSPERRTQSASEAWDRLEGQLIALLGARWRRDAALPAVPADGRPGPATPPPRDAVGGPLTEAWVEASTPRIAAADAAVEEATTIPPRTWAIDEPPDNGAPPAHGAPPADAASPDKPNRGTFLRRWALLAGALLTPILLVAILLGRGGSGDQTPVVTTAEHLGLVTPPGWSSVEPVPDVGLPLSDASAFGPGGSASGPVVIFGEMRGDTAANSALLPDDFLGSLGLPQGELPSRTAVVLSGQELQAWRYKDIRPLGSDRQLTIYTVPTTRGVAAVVCAVPPADVSSFGNKCEPMASTLQLQDAKPYPLGSSDAYASAVNDAIGTLQSAVFTHGKQLAEAKTPAEQSAAASSVAKDYEKAAKQLEGLPLSPADQTTNDSLVAALTKAQRGYENAAKAATSGDQQQYEQARAAAAQDEAALDGPLSALQATGYKPSGGTQGASGESASGGGGDGGGDGGEDDEGAGDSRSDDPSDDAPEHGEA